MSTVKKHFILTDTGIDMENIGYVLITDYEALEAENARLTEENKSIKEITGNCLKGADAEIEKLTVLNAELLEACKLGYDTLYPGNYDTYNAKQTQKTMRAVIEKAKGREA